jgi:hypothetical protein
MAFLLASLVSASANANLLLYDNFDSELRGLNYTSFHNWNVTAGSVDLLGPGFFDVIPGHGYYVDLDGSTNQGGTLESKQLFAPGTYDLSFLLAGNHRGFPADTAFVSLGDASTSGVVPSGFPPTIFTFHFTTHVAGHLKFRNSGGDNRGVLLDDVRLSGPAPVPEPSSLVLAGFGVCGLLSKAIRRRQRVG